MNTQSLKFRLIGWYACLLLGCFVLLGIGTYLALRTSLVSAVRENQLRRARHVLGLAVDHQVAHSDHRHARPARRTTQQSFYPDQ